MRILFLTLLFVQHSLWGGCFDPQQTYDVIIVGAGISGLSAAETLRKNGNKNILVLEADNRIGGRIWTVDPWGSKLELGASWIHGIENSPVFEIVKNLNVTLQPTIYNASCLACKLNSMVIYDENGKQLSNRQMTELKNTVNKFDAYIDSINAKGRNHTLTYLNALDLFAKEQKFSPEMYNQFYFITRLLNTYELPADLENMSVAIEESYKTTKVSGTNAVIPLGYNLVTDKLAKNLPVLLNCRVDQISYNDQEVQLKTSQGLFKATYCIITVPLGVLKNGGIKFSPALPKEKQRAIENLQMGIFDKVYLFYPCVFWDQDVEWIEAISPEKERDRIFDILNLKMYFKQPILLCFTAGSFAKEVEDWTDQQTVDAIQENLRKIYGENIPNPSSYLITRWGKSPFAFGSYSYPGFNTTGATYEALAKPVNGRLFFSGEATSSTDPSTVLGAYTSGMRAANEILRAKGIEPIQED